MLRFDRASTIKSAELVMGEAPSRASLKPPRVKTIATHESPKWTRSNILFEAEPDDWVPAILFVPKASVRSQPTQQQSDASGARSSGKFPAALCLHQTIKIGKKEPAGLGNLELAYALELAERGFITLAPDYPNFGDYKIDVYQRGYASATRKGVFNHMRAVDLLLARDDVHAHRISAIGHSLGGHNAIFLGLFDERVSTIVSCCGFCSFARYYGGNLTGWSHKGYMPRIKSKYQLDPKQMPIDFPAMISALCPRRFLAIAPTGDSNFDVQGVRDCISAAQKVYDERGVGNHLRAFYPDAGHSFPKNMRDLAYSFLAE